MKRTLKYSFSLLLLLLVPGTLFAQDEQKQEKVRIKGPRIGFDLSRLTLYYFEPERTAYEFSLDYEIKRNFYPVIEFGLQNIKLEKPIYNYYSDGYYARFGLDYNFQKGLAADQYEMVFFGFRYGFSGQNHSADNITIADDYWGDFTVTSVPETKLYGHWIELTGGIRAELFRNIFIGWSVRGKLLLYKTRDREIDPYYIHGFGKGDKRVSLGFTYSIFYRLPLSKTGPKTIHAD
ncbi:MAG: DUF6048 family protein [Bacteroidales bacterium]|jgi:hypothetical protein